MAAKLACVAIYLLFLLGTSASATPLLLTAGGTFASYTPTSFMSAPGETWTLSLEIDSNPAVTNVFMNTSFDPAFSDLIYTLNGTVVAIPGPVITFRSAEATTGFDFCINGPACEWGIEVLEAAPLYSGPESAPTILTGVFEPTYLNALVDLSFYPQSSYLPVTITAVTATPEPSTFVLVGAALVLAGALRWRKTSPLCKQFRPTGSSPAPWPQE